MLISEYQSRTEKGNVIASEEKGQQGPGKDAHLKRLRLLCAGSHHGFSQKRPRTPPSPIVF